MVVSFESVPLKANCRMANLPSREIRPRKVISDIRRNETDSVARYSVALISIFRTDNRGESSPFVGWYELPLVVRVADRVHSWIYERNDL